MTSDILCQGCNIIAIAQVGIDIGNTNIKACRMEVIDLEENPEVTVQHRAEQSQGLVVQGRRWRTRLSGNIPKARATSRLTLQSAARAEGPSTSWPCAKSL